MFRGDGAASAWVRRKLRCQLGPGETDRITVIMQGIGADSCQDSFGLITNERPIGKAVEVACRSQKFFDVINCEVQRLFSDLEIRWLLLGHAACFEDHSDFEGVSGSGRVSAKLCFLRRIN